MDDALSCLRPWVERAVRLGQPRRVSSTRRWGRWRSKLYAGLGVVAARILVGEGTRSDDAAVRGWAHTVLAAGVTVVARSMAALCRIGTLARGLVLGIVGGFLVIAASNADSSRAVAVGGALDVLGRSRHGAWLLGGVALGLMSYGACELLVAWRRRFHLRG